MVTGITFAFIAFYVYEKKEEEIDAVLLRTRSSGCQLKSNLLNKIPFSKKDWWIAGDQNCFLASMGSGSFVYPLFEIPAGLYYSSPTWMFLVPRHMGFCAHNILGTPTSLNVARLCFHILRINCFKNSPLIQLALLAHSSLISLVHK